MPSIPKPTARHIARMPGTAVADVRERTSLSEEGMKRRGEDTRMSDGGTSNESMNVNASERGKGGTMSAMSLDRPMMIEIDGPQIGTKTVGGWRRSARRPSVEVVRTYLGKVTASEGSVLLSLVVQLAHSWVMSSTREH